MSDSALSQHKNFLKKAIDLAQKSVDEGGFPAGAIITKDGIIIGSGISIGNKINDPTAHGEMAAIRDACSKLNSSDLAGSILYASMQPCLMCFSASMWASIQAIYYAVKKESVASEYYGGHYKTENINQDLISPIQLIHIPELSEESLRVVKEWELKNGIQP